MTIKTTSQPTKKLFTDPVIHLTRLTMNPLLVLFFLLLLTRTAPAQSYASPDLSRLIVRANDHYYDISRETATAQSIPIISPSTVVVAYTSISDTSPALTAPVFLYAIDGATPAHSVPVGQVVHQPVGGNRPFKPTQKL